MAKYGKDRPSGKEDGYISGSLKGGSGPSAGIVDYKIDRPDQVIKTAVALDNVKLVEPMKSSILEDNPNPIRGTVDNLDHSLTGASAVNEEVGAKGPVKHVIIPNH